MPSAHKSNRVREQRATKGLTQAGLAERAGISRSAVTAIEAERLIPSVAAALALAEALGCTVEELFGQSSIRSQTKHWAWEPPAGTAGYWQAEVAGKTVLYPAGSTPMFSAIPDHFADTSCSAAETLIMACCDPAAGLQASQFAAMTGLRLLVIPRSSRQAVEMLRQGLVHLAGLHLASDEEPDGNTRVIRESLGVGYEMVRIARWQEGITVAPTMKLRSVAVAKRTKLTWIGREPGSGARQCLDRILADRQPPRRTARHHRGVAEAVQSGWADAGICVQLVSAEAGLHFLPVQEEAYDVCFPAALADDRRLKSFLGVVRSVSYRKLLSGLPGYNTSETGQTWKVT